MSNVLSFETEFFVSLMPYALGARVGEYWIKKYMSAMFSHLHMAWT